MKNKIAKKIIQRTLLGIPIGVFIGYLITILISFVMADSTYYAVAPELSDLCGSEINAVAFQAVLCAVYGMGFGAISIFWEIEKWSLLKQTILYFLCGSIISFPITWFAYWFPHTPGGMTGYFVIWIIIFALVWISQYIALKARVKKMNKKINK